MSVDLVSDIHNMHTKYGVHKWMLTQMIEGNADSLRKFLEFRINFLSEELDETYKALSENDAEEVVDGLIDLCVVAIGTLNAFGVDENEAWDRVYIANMNKNVGVKEGRPNPLGLPDLVKPEGWTAPSHANNHGNIPYALTGKHSETD